MIVTLASVGATYSGLSGKTGTDFGRGDARFVPFTEVMADARLRGKRLDPVMVRPGERQNQVRRGDILFNGTSETANEVAMASVVDFDVPEGTYLNSFCFGLRLTRGAPVDPTFLAYYFRSGVGRTLVSSLAQGFTRFNISKTKLLALPLELPKLDQQLRIVDALVAVDDLLASLHRSTAKRVDERYAMMQALLTGAIRLRGFTKAWQSGKVSQVLRPRTERNSLNEDLEVLSCTKHLGFVRSLDYFKNQVFSRDLRSYRVIYRGDIGYPANHVEEGSIGVQELFDRGLVSPIYVVMGPVGDNDTFFLQRQMKLESFRQKFSQATSASVNRRGSLRWPEFSQIEVDIPVVEEQRAISSAIRAVEAEIEALQRRLEATLAIRQGMMQELLTGRTRFTPTEVAA